jgi:ketosteroid isomerase-like protein
MTPTETERFLAEIIPAQTAADAALHNGDPGPRIRLWSHDDPVTLFGAKLASVGWAEVEPTFVQVASWFTGSDAWELDVIAAGASGGLAYTVAYEHGEVVVDGHPRAYTLRVTHVYRREESQWRIVHRHADFPPDPDAPLFGEPSQTRT